MFKIIVNLKRGAKVICAVFMFDFSPLHHVLNWQVFDIDLGNCLFVTPLLSRQYLAES